MKPVITRLLECYAHVFLAEHYYWTHTDGDDAGGQISVENLQRVIERMTKKKIIKRLVDFEGNVLRGNFERYDDRFEINIRKNQPPEWIRFTAVKEMSHALNDQPSEYSAAGADTIKELLFSQSLLDDDMSEQVRSERLAEIFAVELIYPVNFRTDDAALLEAGKATVRDIAKRRGLPLPVAQRHLHSEHLKAASELWATLTNTMKKPLPPLAE